MATAEPTFVAILAMALAACGGTAVIDGGDGSGGSGASGAGGDGSGAGGMGTGGSGTGGAHLTAAIVDATFIADCMPVVPPDPLRGEVFIEWSSDMPGQPGSATIVSAQLSAVVGDVGISIPFDLDPTTVSTAGTTTIDHVKVPDSAEADACALCSEATLLVGYQSAGKMDSATFSTFVGCAL